MSRIRSIHPGFFTDEDLVSVSMCARLLFLGIGVEADDKGIFEWKPLTLKMRIFPADSVDVADMLAELAAVGAIRTFEANGKMFGAIRNFRKFQKPKTPNDIHPATAEILEFVGLVSETNGDEKPSFPRKGEKVPPKGEKSPQMEDGEEDGEGELEPKGSCATEAAPTLKPEHFAESWNSLAKRLGKPCIRDLTPERRQKLKARIAGYSIDDFRAVLAGVERSAFLRGETGWHGCTFDWVTKKANFQKILEGNYDG